ncbi:alpha-glucosidase [Aspergillus sp. HF37]|nr:alpha-glucosidase [Aspergillus sp. HF37]
MARFYSLCRRTTTFTLRLLNNLNLTIYAANIGDPIDRNLCGSHHFYLDTRYEVEEDGALKPATSDETNYSKEYRSFSHGVFMRSPWPGILMRAQNLTWRTLSGPVHLKLRSLGTTNSVGNFEKFDIPQKC